MQAQAITVILNSGKTPEEKARLAEEITAAFSEARQEAHIVAIKDGDDFPKAAESWVKKAKEKNAVVVAAGGDGTVSLVAGLCHRHGVTMGVIPLGTFNYFAREQGIPTTIPEAVNIIATGTERKVAVGFVQERVFLNNASFGLYTKLIRQREEASSRFGRVRIIAAFAAAYSLLREQRLFSIKMNIDGMEKNDTTAMVFVGNNSMQLENLGMEAADCAKQDMLAVVVMKDASRLDIARFILRGAVKNLKGESKLQTFCADHFEVTTKRKTIDLVIDGEIVSAQTPLDFRIEKNALTVLVPAAENP